MRREPFVYCLLFWRELVHYCSQEKETVGLVFRRELVHYCSHEKGTVGLFFWKELVDYCFRRRKPLVYCFEENWSTTVLMRRDRRSSVLKRTGGLVLFQEKETIGLLFWRELVYYCSQEKETVVRLFRRELVHYCSQKKETVGLLF